LQALAGAEVRAAGGQVDSRARAKVVILGDESESKIAEVMVHAMRAKPVDLTGKTGLDILPAVIGKCGLLVTNDGGPMHIAVALDVKTVSIFGPVSEEVYGRTRGSGRL
jgi:ADP-heptose:LPS heptosyltransferase